MKQIEEDCDLLIIADSGVIIRTPAEDVSHFSRVSQGVRIMKLKNDAKITSVALASKEEEPAEAEAPAPAIEEESDANETNAEVSTSEENTSDDENIQIAVIEQQK